jgi:hypothetical protein
MLYANPPIYVIEGVSLYPDHEDPQQFYYLPLLPRISCQEGTGNPSLQLIMYTGSAGKGGFLNFDVDLGIPQARLEKVRAKLKSLQKLTEAPRLAPVPLVDGTVSMTLFGETSGATSAEKKFVTKISYPAKPALYGDNRATFSASLDAGGAALVHRLMDPTDESAGPMSPVSITYSLNFWALRPAYNVRIEADWEQVHSRLAEKFQYSSLIFSADIDRTVDEMLNSQDSKYKLRVDTFVPENEGSDLTARRDAAVEELKEMVTSAFFTPVADPRQEQPPDMLDRVYDKLKRGGAAIASMGLSEVIGCFTFKTINYKAVDTRSLNGDITERTTVLRSLNPQGHLNWAFDALRAQDLDLRSCIKRADLDDPFFRNRTIKVTPGVDFTADSIRSIDVSLDYGKDPKSLSLASGTESKDVSWASVMENGGIKREVSYAYTVLFKDADGRKRPRSLKSDAKVTDAEFLTLDPREMYSFFDVSIEAAPDFPWDRYPSVRVETRYLDEANNLQNEAEFLLKNESNAKSATWKIFQRNPQLRKFQYRITCQGKNSSETRVMAWRESDSARIEFFDPLPGKVEKKIRVSGFDWNDTSLVIVDLLYEDKANKIKTPASFEFTPQNKTSVQAFIYRPLEVPDREMVRYRVTILNSDDEVEIPWSDTGEKIIPIKPEMRGRRLIQVRLASAAFEKQDLRKATVKLEYNDPAAGISAANEFVFQSPADAYTFDFEYVSEKKNRYRYSVEYSYSNGFSSSKDWVETAESNLIIPGT